MGKAFCRVYQDGNRFYAEVNEETTCLFIASIQVKDFDLDAAKLARKEFEEWASKADLDFEWE